MKLKIISDGKCTGTKVVDAETNEPIEGVYKVIWKCDVKGIISEAKIYAHVVAVELLGEKFKYYQKVVKP